MNGNNNRIINMNGNKNVNNNRNGNINKINSNSFSFEKTKDMNQTDFKYFFENILLALNKIVENSTECNNLLKKEFKPFKVLQETVQERKPELIGDNMPSIYKMMELIRYENNIFLNRLQENQNNLFKNFLENQNNLFNKLLENQNDLISKLSKNQKKDN